MEKASLHWKNKANPPKEAISATSSRPASPPKKKKDNDKGSGYVSDTDFYPPYLSASQAFQ